MIDRRLLLAGGLAGLAGAARAQAPSAAAAVSEEVIDLWPHGAPGLLGAAPVERIEEHPGDPPTPNRSAIGIARPRLIVVRPARANGAALLVIPGGGYRNLVFDKEGLEVARWFAARGYTGFVLLYRLPGEGWRNRADVPLADAQRAMRLIRAGAARFGVDPAKIAALGFSAGGHLCADLATRFAAPVYDPIDAADRGDARPAAAAPTYAVESMQLPLAHPGSRDMLLGPAPSPALERAHSTATNVRADTPPCFLAHAEDDRTVDVGNTLAFRAACRAAAVSVDTHLFATGGHGFGLRAAPTAPIAAWPDLCHAWLRAHGLG